MGSHGQTGKWEIKKRSKGSSALRHGDIVTLKNQYGHKSYLDTRANWCEHDYYCVSTSSSSKVASLKTCSTRRQISASEWRELMMPSCMFLTSAALLTPKPILEKVNKEKAEEAKAALEGAGATVSLA